MILFRTRLLLCCIIQLYSVAGFQVNIPFSLSLAVQRRSAMGTEPPANQNTNGLSTTTTTTRTTTTNSKTCLYNVPRRDILGGVLGGALWGGGVSADKAQAMTVPSTAPRAATTTLLADLPMIRLRLPQGGLGREYVVIQLMIQGQGPFDFMVDSGLTTELITPHLQSSLGIGTNGDNVRGFGAGGASAASQLVNLDGATLYSGGKQALALVLPNLHAVVTDFPQEHMDPSHDPVEGMVGMELLSRFDTDFDFPKSRLRLYQPGTAVKKGLVEIPAVVINETGLLGIRLSVPGATQPVLAFLDCGSSFSCMNWKAAALLGLPPKGDPSYRGSPAVAALGIDGNPLILPTVEKELTFVGQVELDPVTKSPIGFAPPPKQWTPWNKVRLAVGDLPAFSTILGDGITPFEGPAVLLGLDVLSQRQVILEAGPDDKRARRVWISPR